MKLFIRIFAVSLVSLSMLTTASFAGDPASSNRAAMLHDLLNMAARAQRHYQLPRNRGGGGGSFTSSMGGVGISSISQLTIRPITSNGTYTLGTVSRTSVVLTGTGVAIGADGSYVEIRLSVFRDSVFISYSN